MTPTPLHRYDAARDALLGKSADELAPCAPVAYWSVVGRMDRRWRAPWWRRVWRVVQRRLW